MLRQIDALYEQGAEGKACFAVTYPILLPSALKTIEEDERIEKVVVTNTIPVPPEKCSPKIEVLSIAPLLADIINRVHQGISISEKLVIA